MLQQLLLPRSLALKQTLAACAAPSRTYVSLTGLRDNDGAKRERRRLGRGPSSGKGKTSGRGHNGQNSRSGSGGLNPGFAGGQKTFLRTIPKMGMKSLRQNDLLEVNLDKLQEWIQRGRLDATQRITARELLLSGICGNECKGIKLLARDGEAFSIPNLDIETSAASEKAIQRIEELGGRFTAVYHSELGLRSLVRPHAFSLLPKFARPTHRNDIDYYASKEKRGYLADMPRFAAQFLPRGYIGLNGEGAGTSFRRVQVQCTVKGLEEVFAKRREERSADAAA